RPAPGHDSRMGEPGRLGGSSRNLLCSYAVRRGGRVAAPFAGRPASRGFAQHGSGRRQTCPSSRPVAHQACSGPSASMPEPGERPPIGRAPLSVVLTAQNNEAEVEDALRAWAQHLQGLERDFEIILIDDGSSDRTRERAEAFSARQPYLRILAHAGPEGIGSAIRTGLNAA